jgi:hypothetical protein
VLIRIGVNWSKYGSSFSTTTSSSSSFPPPRPEKRLRSQEKIKRWKRRSCTKDCKCGACNVTGDECSRVNFFRKWESIYYYALKEKVDKTDALPCEG